MVSLQHRLSAILTADAAGCSRVMAIDDLAKVLAAGAVSNSDGWRCLHIAAGLEDPGTAVALR
jgi:hypothetical protein